MSFQNILEDLEIYLEYRMDEGVRTVEVSPDIVKGLSSCSTESAAAGLRRAVAATAAQAGDGRRQGFGGQVDRGSPVEKELKKIAGAIASCKKCPLHKTRIRTVPGQGSYNSEIMFIGEAPGADEDREGLAFVGAAGQLLTKMIQAMGYTREEVFIGNILKCRPPDNRTPLPDEMAICMPYLKAQIALLKPKVIITLGATAIKGLLDISTGITKLRGTWLSFEGIDVMPTYHPAYLLYQRNRFAKKQVWEDLKSVLKRLGREIPKR